MNLNEFAKEVHENAVAHGFYDPAPSDAETIALIHSEISETLQEWRDNKPMFSHKCRLDITCNGDCKFDADACVFKTSIPEGIAVELIDVVLRILDAAAARGLCLTDRVNQDTIGEFDLPQLCCELHYTIASAYIDGIRYAGYDLSDVVAAIFAWLRAHNIDPETLLREKHEYNKARPYRHEGWNPGGIPSQPLG